MIQTTPLQQLGRISGSLSRQSAARSGTEAPTAAAVAITPSSKPSLAQAIHTLKHAIEKLQLAQGMEARTARQLSLDGYVRQVELLQAAFTSLADAVLEEVDTLVAERYRVQREAASAGRRLQELEARVQGKLCQLSGLEDRLDAKLAAAASLHGQVAGLATQQAAGLDAIDTLRRDVKRLHLQVGQLENRQVLAASEAAVAPLTAVQKTQVREFAAELVPAMVANSVSTHMAPLIDEATESCSRSLRADVASTTGLLAADLACLGKEAAAMRGDLSALAGGLQQQQRELGLLSPRLGRLEALEAAGPRASLNLVTALESKVDALVAQEARHSKSVESIVSALVDDTVALNKSTRALEGSLQHQQGQLQDTKEALLRSAKVFSSLLKVPTPVSGTLWGNAFSAPVSSPVRASLAARDAATALAHTSLATAGGYLPSAKQASPVKPGTVLGAAEGSPLRSKYASLLGSMA